MLVYYSLLTIPFIFSLIELQGSKHIRNKWWFVFFLFVIIVGGTNGNGIDWYGYFVQYSDFRNLSLVELIQFEPGFALALILLGDCHILLMLMAIICFLMVYKTIRYECKFPMIGIFVYVATMTLYMYMGVYRHAIAQSIIIFAWRYRYEKKRFIPLILTACLFHYSATIGFIYFFIPKERIISVKKVLIITIVGFVISPLIVSVLSSSINMLPVMMASKLDIYLTGIESGTSFSITFFAFKVFVYLMSVKYCCKSEPQYYFYINTYAVSIIIYLVLSFSPSFGRLVYYYSCAEIILVPTLLYNMAYTFCPTKGVYIKRKKNLAVPVFLFFSFLYTYTFTQSILGYYEIFVPYKSIFFQ